MTDKDKTVGGRTREEYDYLAVSITLTRLIREHLRHCLRTIRHVDCPDLTGIVVEWARKIATDNAHSRGLRDGLEEVLRLSDRYRGRWDTGQIERGEHVTVLADLWCALDAIRAEASKLDGEPRRCGVGCSDPTYPHPCVKAEGHEGGHQCSPEAFGLCWRSRSENPAEERKLPLGCPGYESTEGRDDFCTRVIERVRGERFCARPRSAHSPTTSEER